MVSWGPAADDLDKKESENMRAYCKYVGFQEVQMNAAASLFVLFH